MRIDEVDTLIDQLEEFVVATVVLRSSNIAANQIVYDNMKASLKEYMCKLAGIRTTPVEEYDCPDCGSKMKERKNRQNGDTFFGCVKYPDCKGTRDSEGLSKEERAAKKEVTQQDGFSFRRT